MLELEEIDCPYCSATDVEYWAQECGFNVVRCSSCALLFVNPRIPLDATDEAVRNGVHRAELGGQKVSSRRLAAKVPRYKSILGEMFPDLWDGEEEISWLDIGAGYGEVVEAVIRLAPEGSRVEGLEPMRPKAEAARALGLPVIEGYLTLDHPKVRVVSIIDVFSHIPNFREFLQKITAVLQEGGEVFIETGNLADVGERNQFPGELGVPDHLVFAGASHIEGFLEQAGFSIIAVRAERIDSFRHFAKSIIKSALGRHGNVRLPYTSSYRQLMYRARLSGGRSKTCEAIRSVHKRS